MKKVTLSELRVLIRKIINESSDPPFDGCVSVDTWLQKNADNPNDVKRMLKLLASEYPKSMYWVWLKDAREKFADELSPEVDELLEPYLNKFAIPLPPIEPYRRSSWPKKWPSAYFDLVSDTHAVGEYVFLITRDRFGEEHREKIDVPEGVKDRSEDTYVDWIAATAKKLNVQYVQDDMNVSEEHPDALVLPDEEGSYDFDAVVIPVKVWVALMHEHGFTDPMGDLRNYGAELRADADDAEAQRKRNWN